MERGISLGRWAGVPISAHWSVLFTLALFADILATSALPTARPGHATVTYWLAGILTAMVFLLTLLAHELAHAVVARHYRMRPQRITLWMLGGVTELDGEPPTPRADALIAAAGPATTFGLGAASGALAWWVGGVGLLGAALGWLAGVSVLLAVFNLLPGAPLDGGRLLRGLLWWRYGDRARAENAVARSGRALGTVLIGLGFFELLAGGFAGLWLALIGWFILNSAASESLAGQAERLNGLCADDLMTPAPTVVYDWWTVQQFLSQHASDVATHGVVPLVDFGGEASGVVRLRDLERVPAGQREDIRIRDITRSRRIRPLMVTRSAPLTELAPRLRLHGGVAVVVDDVNHPVGIITAADIARAAHLADPRKGAAPAQPR